MINGDTRRTLSRKGRGWFIDATEGLLSGRLPYGVSWPHSACLPIIEVRPPTPPLRQPGSMPFFFMTMAADGDVRNFANAFAASGFVAPVRIPLENMVMC